MPEGPDPLGKRALFWMPVEPEAEGDALLDGPGGVAVEDAPASTGRPARPTGRPARTVLRCHAGRRARA